MENGNISKAIIQEMNELLEKTAVSSVTSLDTASDLENQEAILISLKAINARYDKHEAIIHVRAIMEQYNIQIDELLELINH